MSIKTEAKKARAASAAELYGRVRKSMPRPKQVHKDRKKAARKYACRNKGRRRDEY